MYYGQASDPIYKIDSCPYCGTGSQSALNTYWHIPNQALANRSGDPFFAVWDQTSNRVLGTYNYNGFPSCTATTQATACNTGTIYSAQVTNYTSDTDYSRTTGGGDSLRNAVFATVVRHKEWMDGVINHALYLNTLCGYDGSPFFVFPATADSGMGTCSQGNGDQGDPNLRPKLGSLFFLDYTDSQIDGMGLPAWQKTLIRAMAHYGGYIGDVNDPNAPSSINVSRFESGQAYIHAGGSPSPVYKWLEGQGISCGTGPSSESPCRYNLPMLDGIPDVTGPNCRTTACGVEQHLHIADACVAKGLAGIAGGCGVPAIKSPTNLRITLTTP
jgi:hypothetical protein